MPFIDTKTTAVITPEKEETLRRRLGEAIALLPGKSEEWLMLNFTDRCRMAFRGRADGDIAIAEIKIFGKASDAAYNKLTTAVCDIFREVLGIPGERVYVKYEEIDHWGYNGNNF